MYDADESFKKARELIDFFLDDNILSPKHIFDVSERLTNGYLYRGQAFKDWTLLPTVHRATSALSNFTPQLPHGDLDNNKRLYLGTHIHAELRSIQLFLEAADHIGINTPLDYSITREHQTLLNSLFSEQEDIEQIKEPFPVDKFIPSMALAQHYGVPTRLLDWTESPLIAAYFAAEKALTFQNEKGDDDFEFSIICIGTQLLGKVKSIQYVRAPSANNPFLRTQRGAFTLIKNANQFFYENGRWPSIEDIVNNERDNSIMYTRAPFLRLSLPAGEAKELLRLLYRLDISKLTVMPSYENAAEHFNYKKGLWGK